MSKAQRAITRQTLEAMARTVSRQDSETHQRIEAMSDAELQAFVDDRVTVISPNEDAPFPASAPQTTKDVPPTNGQKQE